MLKGLGQVVMGALEVGVAASYGYWAFLATGSLVGVWPWPEPDHVWVCLALAFAFLFSTDKFLERLIRWLPE